MDEKTYNILNEKGLKEITQAEYWDNLKRQAQEKQKEGKE